MSTDLTLDLDFPVCAGACIAVSPLVRRIVADNPGPITFTANVGEEGLVEPEGLDAAGRVLEPRLV